MTVASSHAPRADRAPRLGPLLAGTAVLALVLGAGMARGQTFIGNGVAFQGSAAAALGNVTLASTNTTDTLTVHTPTAIVDWTPYDTASGTAPIMFLPGGSTGIFQNGGEVAGFTVLNRINPTSGRPIELDGHVISQLVDSAGAVTRGGNVWFYAPGGLIIGSTGVFDVGSLILTTNAIDTSGDTALPTPTGGLRFTGVGGSTAAVDLQSGARITQTAPGSYLAIVAPRIDQAGTVTVNGSAGYVAAQAADITIDAGLFNITGAIGSTVAAGGETTLSHSGATTGPAQDSAGSHQIYMVAIPQNDAVTMLVSGTVGYQAAASATQVNGTIVLDAGHGSTLPGDVQLGTGSYSSGITASATRAFTASTATGAISLASLTATGQQRTDIAVTGSGDLSAGTITLNQTFGGTFNVGREATVTVDAGRTLAVTNHLTMYGGALLDTTTNTNVGGDTTLSIAGTATIGHNLLVSSAQDYTGSPRNSTGGNANVEIEGGALTVTGLTTIDANATGGIDTGSSVHTGRSGNAGIANLYARGDGAIANLIGGTQLYANAATAGSAGVAGGSATAGNATLQGEAGGTVNAGGQVIVEANATTSSNATTLGTARAGLARISADQGTVNLTSASSSIAVAADASGGNSTGGDVGIVVANGGIFTSASVINLDTRGLSGTGATIAGRGGAATIQVTDGSFSTSAGISMLYGGEAFAATTLVPVNGTALVSVGDGGQFTAGSLVTGAFGNGGEATVSITGSGVGRINGTLTLQAYASPDSFSTGSRTGGVARIIASGGELTVTGATALYSRAQNTDIGGTATGGDATIDAVSGGTITLADTTIDASAYANPAAATAATGGIATLSGGSGGTVTIGGSLAIAADATGYGAGTAIVRGGTAGIDADGGTVRLTDTLVTANALGGDASGGEAFLYGENGGVLASDGMMTLAAIGQNGAGAGQAALGGTARIAVTGGTLSIGGTTTIDARGIATAASGTAAPAGYDATGGTAGITVGETDGTLASSATFSGLSTVLGGAIAYQSEAVATGSATGGTAAVDAAAGGSVAFNGGLLLDSSAAANATGTDPGLISTGGRSLIDAAGGTIALADTSPTLQSEVSADAGGGTATGGTAGLSAGGGGSITATNTLFVHARGTGGEVENGSIPGYDGTGGTTSVTAADGTIALAAVDLDPTGTGGDSASFEGGAGTGGTASIATTDPAGRIVIDDYANLQPFGYAGGGATGAANGRGGTSSVTATGGSISFTGDGTNPTDDARYLGYALYAIADGLGSSALGAGRDPATSGLGYGGTVRLTADEGGTIAIADNAYLSPYGTAGFSSVSGASSDAIGGSVTLAALNGTGQPGTISFGSLFIDNGAFGYDGGAATAGTSDIRVAQGAAITGTTLTAQTYARGGAAESGGAAQDGGAATGGSTTVTIDGGTLSITGDAAGNGLEVSAFAEGGASVLSGTGGAATGSTASVTVNSGTLATSTLIVDATDTGGASGDGVDAIGGTGGAASGGSALLAVGAGDPARGIAAGTVSVGSLEIGTAVAGGGGGAGATFFDDPTAPTSPQNGFAGGDGGAASGGTATLAMTGGVLTATELGVTTTTMGGNGGRGGDGAGASTDGPAPGGPGGAGGTATLNGATLSVLGGTVTAAATTVSSSDNGGTGGGGGLGGTDPISGARTQAMAGLPGNARGGGATIETDFGGSARLGATTLTAGGVLAGTTEAGTITLAANDSDGNAPATPLTLDSLTATMIANLTTTGDLVQVTAAAPIVVAGDATIAGFTLSRFDTSGPGTLAVGGALTVDTLEVIGTQTAPTVGTIAITAGSAAIDARFAGVTLATLTTTAGDLDLTAAQQIAATDLVAAGNATLAAAGSIGFGDLTAATDIDITAGGALSGVTLASTHGAIDATAAGSIAITTVTAGGGITIDAGGSARYGAVTGGTDPASGENDGGTDFGSVALLAQGDLAIDGGVSAYRSIGLVAGDALSAPSLVAANGGSVGVIAGGAIDLGTVAAPDLFYVGGLGAVAGLDPDASAGAIVAALRAAGPVASGDAVSIGGAEAGSAIVDAGGTLAIADALATTGDATVSATGAIDAATLAIGGSLTLAGQSTTTIGTVTAGTDLFITSRDDLSIDTATAGRDADIYTVVPATDETDLLTRSARIGSVTAGDDATLGAWNTLTVDTITTTGLGADGTTPGGYPDVAGSGVTLYGGSGVHVGAIVAQSSVLADNFIQSIDGVEQAHGLGGVTLDSVSAGGTVTLTSAADAVSATIVAAGPVTASGTSVTLAAPSASLEIAQATASAGDVTIDAGGDLTATGAITSATGDVDLSAGGAVDLVALSAGDSATVSAGTTLHAGSITVGTDATSAADDGSGVFGSLALIAGDAITVDTPFAVTGSVGLVSRTAGIDLDSLAAGANGSVAVLAGGDIRLGAVTAPSLLYVGGPAAIAALGDAPSVPEILGALTAAGPVASGGAVSIGQASAGSATIAAGTTLTIGGPLVASIGTATLVSSGDLAAQDVTAPGAVSVASSTGAVTIGTIRAGSATLSAGTTLLVGGPLTATAGAVTLASAGDLGAQDVTATGAVSAASRAGAVTIGAVAAGLPTIAGGIRLTAPETVTAGPLAASGAVAAASTAAGLVLQDVTSTGGGVTATAGGGDIALGAVRAAGSITIAGTGRITAGDLTAGTGALLAGESGGGAGSPDPATGGIAAGFDGVAINRCDDCYTDGITLPFTVNYFGTSYATTYVSNNGYLTFNTGQGTYTPGGLGTGYFGQPIIAAFFADVDTNNPLSAQVTYGSGTFAGRQAFGATWNGVGYFPSAADKLNNFQIVLTNRADTGAGNFDIYYNYTNIGWETGAASSGVNGFGGISAAVGYNAGVADSPAGTFFELPGSRVPGSFINGGTAPLVATTNDGIAGQLLFTVRNGQVSAGVAAEPPTIHVSNLSGTGTSDIQLGALSAEGAEVHGTGRVTVGTVSVGDRGSGVTAPGQAFATVLDAGLGLSAGDVSSTGLIALGSRTGDVSAGTVTGGASVIALADGSVTLGRATTGTGATDTLYIGGAATDALTGFDFATLLSGRGFDPATLASLAPVAAGGAIAIAGPVTTGNLRAAATGTVTLGAASATGAMLIDGGAGLVTGALSAGGTIDLAASAGGISTGAIAGARDVTATASGDVALGAVTAADLTATSTGGALALGATDATGSVALAAAGTLSLASIDATDITLASSDIAIASRAAIGSARTTTLAFLDTGRGRTVIGDGAGAAAGDYALSAAELAGAHANAISVGSQPATDGAGPDTLIGTLALNGAASSNANLLGAKAAFTVTGAGTIRVLGAARFTGLAGDETVTLRSTGGDIVGVLPAGSIALDDGRGRPAGTLALDARTIRFTTPAAADALIAATTPAAIDAALGDPGGLANPAGYLRADTVSLRFSNALYTQNSGASAAITDRAGVTAGNGGILLVPTTADAAAPANLVLNATLEQGGATLTGNQVFQALALQPTGFAAGATLNACLLDASNCGVTTTIPEGPVSPADMAVTALVQVIQPVQDVVSQVQLASGLGNAVAYSFTSPSLISSIDLSPPVIDDQIDEPVTGAGNESLWVNIGVGRELAPMGGKPGDAVKP